MAIFKVTAVPDFSQLRGEIARLQGSPVTLGVDTRQANVNIKATTQNLKKLTETFSPDGELVHSVSNYSKRVGEVVTVTKSLDRESGEMAVTSKKVTQNFEAQARAAQKAAKEVQSAADAYRAYAAQQNKGYTPTAMQRRIESITGISGGSTKSAADSAKVFERAWLNASGKVQDGAQKAARDVKNVGKAAKETSGFADLMGDSFGRVAAKMAMWQLLGNAIAGVKRSFVGALDTMKSVDDEMVTIRKVTGASADELEKIEKQAYKTASAYGVAADDYLQFVSGFSRAGYGEQASALAELAAKTQIVGDTNAETAQQFLLSVDAAYKYQGNIEKLTAVLDGANEIDNRYATSIQKVAEGLGKVAPIAAQAHVGVDELTAAIGTITAVTQRSGTEAATALRALFLNIIGDTKTEIDEGVTWTTGEIAGLRDVIKVYAKDAYDAAQATGSVINPMKAIAGLSKSMKDGLLTEQQLMEMVSDIGGKLRTSQLLALIQNWDMYESMLTDFAGAAGSADKEVENALDSWTRKTEILKNKWTEFVSHLVETDTIKGALDGVIKLVELLDTDVGRFVVTVAALTAGVNLLGKAGKFLFDTKLIKNGKKLVGILADAASGAGSFGDALTLLNPKMLIVVAGVAALYGAYKFFSKEIEKANRTLASFDEEINGVNSQLEANKSRIEQINNMPWAERTSAILEEKAALEKENAELEKKLKLLDKEKTERAREIVKETVGTGEMVTVSHKGTTSGSMSTTFEKTVAGAKAYEFLTEQLNEYSAALERNGEIADSVKEQYEKDIAASARMVEALKQMRDAGDELTDEQLQLIAAYDSFVTASDRAQNATKQYVSKLVEEAQQSGATGKALYDLVAAQITSSNTQLNFSQQIAALRQLAAEAGYATEAYGKLLNEGRIFQESLAAWRSGVYGSMEEARAAITAKAWNRLTGTAPSGGWGGSSGGSSYAPSGGGYSGGSSTSSSSRKNDLDNAKKKAAQATIDAIRKQMKAETDAIDEQIDAIREKNKEEERSKKLEELKLDILKKQDALLNARNERTVRQYNAATGQWEWVANPEKVKQAQEDLENARKDLREYEADVEREIAISELEARKKAIEAAYQLKIDVWQKLIDQLNGDVETERALLAASLGDWDTYYQEMLKVYEKLVDAAGSMTNGEKWYLDERVRNNQIAANDVATAWEDAAERQRKAMDAIIRSAVIGAANPPSGKKPSASAAVVGAVTSAAKPPSGKKPTTTTKPSGMGGGSRFNTNVIQKYDSGGILKGMGGIKATEQDEMILPPDITRKLISPVSEQKAMQVIHGMRAMLGGNVPLSQSFAGRSDNRRYSDHSGAEYHIGNVTLSQQQAECTTIAQVIHGLVEQSYHLKPYGN
nr:MAG TPA: minor tail protein [Caudoviricetes sp.]